MALAAQLEQPREEGLGDVDRVPLPQESFHSLAAQVDRVQPRASFLSRHHC